MVTVRASSELGFSQSYNGPWEASSGDLYVIARDETNSSQMQVIRSVNGGDSWNLANTWSSANGDISSMHGEQEGDIIHIVQQDATDDAIYYRQYDMANATWNTGSDTIHDATTDLAVHCSVAVMPNGNVHLAFQTTNVQIMGGAYERVGYNYSTDNGGTFLVDPIALHDDAAEEVEESYQNPTAVADDSGRVHFFWAGVTNSVLLNRTATDGEGTLSAEQTYDTSTFTNLAGYPHKNAIFSSVNGEIYLPIGTADNTGHLAIFTPSDAISAADTIETITSASPIVAGAASQLALAINSAEDTLYAVWVDTSNNGVFYSTRPIPSGSWSSVTDTGFTTDASLVSASLAADDSALLVLWDNSVTDVEFDTVGLDLNLAETDARNSSDRTRFVTPINLQVTQVSDSELQVDWNQMPPADDYDLQREKSDGGGGWIETTNITGVTPPYNDTGLDGGTTYRYRVRSTQSGA